MARLQTHLPREDRARADEEVRLQVGDAGAAHQKITLNMGVGEAVVRQEEHRQRRRRPDQDRRPEAGGHQGAQGDRELQDPRGLPIGCMVTLRGERMYEFLDRLVTSRCRACATSAASRPRFDGRGNYNIGVKEQIIFPEIEYDKIDALRGMNISITTTAKTDDEVQGAARRVPVPVQELRGTWQSFPEEPRSQARGSWSRSTRRRSAPS
jgi:large subunit ribosomal protein L5